MSDWTKEDEEQWAALRAKKAAQVEAIKQRIRELMCELPETERHSLICDYGYERKLWDFNRHGSALREAMEKYSKTIATQPGRCTCPVSWPGTKAGDVFGWGGHCPEHSPSCT